MAKLNFTDLDRPENQHKPIWVLNKSSGDHRGPVIFTCSGDIGGRGLEPVRVANTWLPLNLLEQMPRARLLGSTDFRSAVINGLLSIIDDEEAQVILSRTGSRDELERLQAEKDHLANIGFPARDGNDSGGANIVSSSDDGEPEDDGLSRQVRTILNRLGTEPEMRTINQLRNVEDTLTDKELRQIIKQAKAADLSKVVAYARSRQEQ